MSRLIEQSAIERVFATGTAAPLLEEPCPEPDALWNALGGEGSDWVRRSVLDHCARCPSCAQDLGVTQRMQRAHAGRDAAPEPGEVTPMPKLDAPQDDPVWTPAPAANHSPKPYLWAAVAAAAVLLLWVGQRPRPARDVTYRGEDGPELAVDASSKLDAQTSFREGRFQWPSDEAGGSYELVIVDRDFDVVCRLSALRSTSVLVEPKRCPAWDADAPFFWWVRMTGTHGEVTRTPVRFEDHRP